MCPLYSSSQIAYPKLATQHFGLCQDLIADSYLYIHISIYEPIDLTAY